MLARQFNHSYILCLYHIAVFSIQFSFGHISSISRIAVFLRYLSQCHILWLFGTALFSRHYLGSSWRLCVWDKLIIAISLGYFVLRNSITPKTFFLSCIAVFSMQFNHHHIILISFMQCLCFSENSVIYILRCYFVLFSYNFPLSPCYFLLLCFRDNSIITISFYYFILLYFQDSWANATSLACFALPCFQDNSIIVIFNGSLLWLCFLDNLITPISLGYLLLLFFEIIQPFSDTFFTWYWCIFQIIQLLP